MRNYHLSKSGPIFASFTNISPKLMQLSNLFQFISNKVPNRGFRVKRPNLQVKVLLFSPDSHRSDRFTGWVEAPDFWCAANKSIFAFQWPPTGHFASPEAIRPINPTYFIVILHQEGVKMHISKWRAVKPRFSAKTRFSPPTQHTTCKYTRVSANSPKLCLGGQSGHTLRHSTPNCTSFDDICTVAAKIAHIAPKLSFTTRFRFWRVPAPSLPASQSSQFAGFPLAALQQHSVQCPKAPCFVAV